MWYLEPALRKRARGVALGLWLAGAAASAGPPGASADEAPFDVMTWEVRGRSVEIFAASEGLAPARLVVLSVEGVPPDERRWITLFPPPARGDLIEAAASRPWVVEAPAEVVAVDVAELREAAGPEIVLLRAEGLEIRSEGLEPETIAFPARLPLPPRTRQLSRLRMLRDWRGDGSLVALVPDLDGALLMPLGEAPADELERIDLPVLTHYETFDEARPVHQGYATARLIWPSLIQGDDDGDGRDDLFALSRFDLAVFRARGTTLGPEPSRRQRLPPFSPEEERRHETSVLRAYVRDFDADGRADLVVHRSSGTLMRSHSSTALFTNPGEGANPAAEPRARLETEGGFGAIELHDLDGDLRPELVHTVVPFGVLQVIRVLVTRRVEASLRVYRYEPDADAGALVQSWRTQMSFGVDFDQARVVGLLPTLAGDWNGDGTHDLLYGDGRDAISVRLGRRGDGGVSFERGGVRQEIPSLDVAVVADWDGDGLHDLAGTDPLEPKGRVQLCMNRGVLPGSPPRLTAPKEPGALEAAARP